MVNDSKCLKPIGSQRGAYSKLQPQYSEIIDYFIFIQIQKRSLSNRSILDLANIGSVFLCRLQSKGKNSLSEISEKDVIDFFIKGGKPLCGTTFRYSLYKLLNSVSDRYPECKQLADWLPYIRVTRKNIQYLTDDEAQKIKEICLDTNSGLSFLDKAIGLTLLYTGLRSCDIAGLKLTNINWEKETISVVQRKTDVPLVIPMHVHAGNAIYDYISNERKTDSEYLFVMKKNKRFQSSDVSYCVTRIFNQAGIRQNKGDRRGTHIFRHHLATKLLENEVAQPVISQALGHTDPVSVETYLSADIKHLRECSLSIEDYLLDWEVVDHA